MFVFSYAILKISSKLVICAAQHSVGYVTGDEYYGAQASINVWVPQLESQYEFSLSQIWIISGSFGEDLNTIEAGWQVCQFLIS